jgi:HEPN domain-containing protein
LEKILKICVNLDKDFEELDLLAISLNGLDVRFRYPDIEFEPEKIEVEISINWATQILDFVRGKCH